MTSQNDSNAKVVTVNKQELNQPDENPNAAGGSSPPIAEDHAQEASLNAPQKTAQAIDPYANVPEEFKILTRWVVWKHENRESKPTKILYDPRTGHRADSTDSKTWADYSTALSAADKYNGIGFVIAEPYCGIDLDKCRDPQTGAVEPWAEAVIREVNSYTELSPSGRGFHIWTKAKLPPNGRKKGRVEMYDSDRYFTMTGQHYQGTPLTVEPRDLTSLHKRMVDGEFGKDQKTKSGAGADSTTATGQRNRANNHTAEHRVDDLWMGNWEPYYNSQSEADLAFCSILAKQVGNDPDRIDEMFRKSGLIREKWDEHHGSGTYGEITIKKALESKTSLKQQSAPSAPLILPVDDQLARCADFLSRHGISSDVAEKHKLFFHEHPALGETVAIPRITKGIVEGVQYVSTAHIRKPESTGSKGAFYVEGVDLFNDVVICPNPLEALRLKSLGFFAVAQWSRETALTQQERDEIQQRGGCGIFSTFDIPGYRKLEPIDRWTKARIEQLLERGRRPEWRNMFKSPEEMNDEPLKFLIDGFFLEESALFFGALAGHGKTLVGLSMAKAFITGQPFLGHFTVKEKVPVLYLTPENGEKALKLRLKAFGIDQGEDFLCRTFSDGVMPKLDDSLLLQAAQGRIVVLDTAVRFMDSKDENSALENKQLADNVFTLLARGARGVVGFHHSPKSFEDATYMSLENVLRGTTDIGAMVGACYGMRLIDRASTRIHIECVKSRDFEGPKAFEIEGRPFIDNEGDFKMVALPGKAPKLTSANKPKQAEKDQIEQIKRHVQVKPEGQFLTTLRNTCGLGHEVADRLIREGDGIYWRIGEGKKKGTKMVFPIADNEGFTDIAEPKIGICGGSLDAA